MALIVRKIQEDDYSQWQPLFRGYRQFYKQADDSEKENLTWQWLIDDKEPIMAIVCEDSLDNDQVNDKGNGNKLIGFMHYEQQTSSLSAAKIGFLNDLYIDPASRGKKAFEELYNYLRNHGKEKDWTCIQWRTAENNYRARSAYDRISEKSVFLTYRMDL